MSFFLLRHPSVGRSLFRANQGGGFRAVKVFGENTLARRERGRFFPKPAGLDLDRPPKNPKYLCPTNKERLTDGVRKLWGMSRHYLYHKFSLERLHLFNDGLVHYLGVNFCRS
jgi:hypothetical protein